MNNKYNKLVRDKIPEIISSHGEEAIIKVLSDKEYREVLDKKLLEEVKEYLDSGNLEELADILEVIRSICKIKKVTLNDVVNIMEEKKIHRGGFDNKIFLVDVVKKKSM